jgi:hypothetical protein
VLSSSCGGIDRQSKDEACAEYISAFGIDDVLCSQRTAMRFGDLAADRKAEA